MAFWSVLGLLQKAYSLGFLLEDRHEGRQLPYGGLDVCPDKPAKINLSIFGRLTLPEMEDERGAF